MESENIYFKDLACYQKLSVSEKQHKLMCPNRCFNIEKLPTDEIRKEIGDFVRHRGRVLTALSIRAEFYPFNKLCSFLNTTYPTIRTFHDIDLAAMEHKCKTWLLRNGNQLTQKRYKTATGKEQVIDADILKYIREIYKFSNPCNKAYSFEADKWTLDEMPIMIRQNPSRHVNYISFCGISQKQLKDEIKQVMYIRLTHKAIGTINAELTAINRFSLFLKQRYPEVESLLEVDRELLENYLIFTNTEEKSRKSYVKDLCHLKSIFTTGAKVLENKRLGQLFYRDDTKGGTDNLYKIYSDAEIERLNTAVLECDEQIARLLMLHQLLGTRISETLTLKMDSIYQTPSGDWMIRIRQIKSKKSYNKAVNDDVRRLFDSSCRYTIDHFGTREYVFVTDKEPEKPMQYSRIQYQLMAMITKNDLRDDHGERFGVGTHIWRHCYGKRLTEMHVDDSTIAKLMGHCNTSSLKNYRRVGNEMLAKETKGMRDYMDSVLDDVMKGW